MFFLAQAEVSVVSARFLQLQSWNDLTNCCIFWKVWILMFIFKKFSTRNFAGPLLLFEGGTWRWPTVRVNFARELLPGVRLRTVAVQPALFDFEFSSSSQGQVGDDDIIEGF